MNGKRVPHGLVLVALCSMQLTFVGQMRAEIIRPARVDPRLEKKRLAQIRKISQSGQVKKYHRMLIQWIATDPSMDVQFSCAKLLGKYVSPDVKRQLLGLLRTRKVKGSGRSAAWDALTRQAAVITDKEVAELLKTQNSIDFVAAVRMAGNVDISEETRTAILAHLQEGTRDKKTAVVSFLRTELNLPSEFNSAKRIDDALRQKYAKLLDSVLSGESDMSLRRYAASTLEYCNDKSALPALITFLRDEYRYCKKRWGNISELADPIATIEKLSGRSFDFRKAKDEKEREEVVRALTTWWEEEGRKEFEPAK